MDIEQLRTERAAISHHLHGTSDTTACIPDPRSTLPGTEVAHCGYSLAARLEGRR